MARFIDVQTDLDKALACDSGKIRMDFYFHSTPV